MSERLRKDRIDLMKNNVEIRLGNKIFVEMRRPSKLTLKWNPNSGHAETKAAAAAGTAKYHERDNRQQHFT